MVAFLLFFQTLDSGDSLKVLSGGRGKDVWERLKVPDILLPDIRGLLTLFGIEIFLGHQDSPFCCSASWFSFSWDEPERVFGPRHPVHWRSKKILIPKRRSTNLDFCDHVNQLEAPEPRKIQTSSKMPEKWFREVSPSDPKSDLWPERSLFSRFSGQNGHFWGHFWIIWGSPPKVTFQPLWSYFEFCGLEKATFPPSPRMQWTRNWAPNASWLK